MKVRVRITCEECGHVNEQDVDVQEKLPVAEPTEDAPLRGFRTLPVAEPLDDDENGE